MKLKHTITTTLLFLLYTSSALSQITFQVSDVVKATDTIKEIAYKDALEISIEAEIESFDYSKKHLTLIPTYRHSFFAAMHHCYADHRPMVISPDMIWLMICQKLAEQIECNSDSLRRLLVDLPIKKVIKIRNDNLIKGKMDNDWAGEINKFTDSLKKYVHKDLYELMLGGFSTTTKTEQIAFQITLMKAVDTYFDYIEDSLCGIPEITLEGTKKDWKKIYLNSQKLKIYGLEKWADNLRPILKEFVKASKGKIDKKFWQSIYQYNSGCGNEGISGWALIFLGNYKNNERAKFEYLPSGYTKVNMKWNYNKGLKPQQYNMELYAGFMGIEQNLKTLALKPVIGWAIRDTNSNNVSISNAYRINRRLYNTQKSSDYINEYEDDFKIDTIDVVTIEPEVNLEYEQYNGAYINPEVLPEYKNGDIEFIKYIKAKITQSNDSLTKDVSTDIFIRFTITKKGRPKDISITGNVNMIQREQITRAVLKSPKWLPGRINGKKVNAWYVVPVNFKLNHE